MPCLTNTDAHSDRYTLHRDTRQIKPDTAVISPASVGLPGLNLSEVYKLKFVFGEELNNCVNIFSLPSELL